MTFNFYKRMTPMGSEIETQLATNIRLLTESERNISVGYKRMTPKGSGIGIQLDADMQLLKEFGKRRVIAY